MVSGDEGGTICLWNLTDGRREGTGFSLHSRPAAASAAQPGGTAPASSAAAQKLTAMAFDGPQRRLLTATDAGALLVFNFNSGAVLRRFVHREGPKEVTAVAFVPPPHCAAEEDAAAAEEGSGSQPEQGAGSGAGEEPAEVGGEDSSGGGYSELSEHALLALQHASAQHQPPAAEGSASDAGSDAPPPSLVLAAGWSRCLCVWEEGEGRSCSAYRRLAGHGADVLSLVLLGRDVAATGVCSSGGHEALWKGRPAAGQRSQPRHSCSSCPCPHPPAPTPTCLRRL